MAINTTTIDGFVHQADGSVRERSYVIFTQTGFDTDDGSDAVVVSTPIRAPIAVDGSISQELWPNQDGVRVTYYNVTFELYNGTNAHFVNGGYVEVPATGGPYALSDLLAVSPSSPANPSIQELLDLKADQVDVDTLESQIANIAVASGSGPYATVADGLAATSDGDVFTAYDGDRFVGYQNDAGAAVELSSFASLIDAGVTPYIFGAVGDGVADDTSAVISAALYAFTYDLPLVLNGQFDVASNIPHLHEVLKTGTGAIVRGGNSFSVRPDQSAIDIYVSTSGNDANDGISPSSAVETVARAQEIVRSLGDYVVKVFTVNLAAGTYTETMDWSTVSSKTKRITVAGPPVTVGSVPTAVFDAVDPSDTALTVGLEGRFIVEDIHITGYTSGQAVNVNGGYVTLKNVHTTGCWKGVINQHGGFVAFGLGCRFDGTGAAANSIGFTAYYNATHDSGATSAVNAPTFLNYTRGMQIGEGAQGHVDYFTLTDNDIGVDFKRGCGACNTKGMVVHRNAIGVLVQNTGWYDNQIDFGSGADVNTINVQLNGSAPEFKYLTQDNNFKTMRTLDTVFIPQVVLSGSEQVFFTLPISDWMISDGGHQIEFKARLQCALTGNLIIRSRLFDVPLAVSGRLGEVTIPSSATFVDVVVTMGWTAKGAQRGTIQAIDQAGNVLMNSEARTVDLFNKAGEFRFSVSGTSGDTVAAYLCSCSTTLGG